MLIRFLSLVAVTLGVVALAGAGHAADAAPARDLTDARILGTLGAGDADQIEAAKLAATKASAKDVRDYAKMMIHDHQESFETNTKLAKRFRLSRTQPEDSAMAREHKQEMTQLNLLAGSAFDLAFLQAMVTDHATLIQNVKTTLLPAAQRNGVKAFIRELLPVLTGHQSMGQALLDKQK